MSQRMSLSLHRAHGVVTSVKNSPFLLTWMPAGTRNESAAPHRGRSATDTAVRESYEAQDKRSNELNSSLPGVAGLRRSAKGCGPVVYVV